MKYQFFHILAIDPEYGTAELNAYLQQNLIHSIERQFVDNGSNSFWSICVCTHQQEQAQREPSKQKGKPKVDYQAELSPEHFAIFVNLRTLRNQIAEEQGIPAYAVFTNEQLAKVSQLKAITLSAMSEIKGIGGKRLNIYAQHLLDLLNTGKSNA